MKVLSFFLIINLIQSISSDDGVKFEELAIKIRPNVDEKTQQREAMSVIRRLISEKADNVAVKINFKLPLNYFKLRKTNNSEVLRIEADSGVSACKGFHYYLKYYCNAHISWDGHQLATIPDDEFPPVNDFEMQSNSQIVYYQNVCTHSYSYSFWTWEDWRRHIDWIALNGITLTLAPFQEDIWKEVYLEYGLSEAEIDADFAGIGFFAWQRMGNIRGWGGPLSASFIEFASRMQQQMIKALNDLGIAVALQAFDGHLPISFKSIFPNASFTSTSQWNDFPAQFCCPLFIDPTDPLFTQIGEKFLRAMIRKYGTNHIYFSDPYNEVQPAVASVNYLRNVSTSIYSAMVAVDPDAIWLLQGWFMVNSPIFWIEDFVEAFLTAVPKGKLLVLDLQSETHPQYNRTNSFYGQPFIWNMLHNFGGTLGMHGSIRIVNTEIPRAANELKNSTMVGVGITPEGIFQNYVVYQFALEKAWSYKEINHKKWIRFYARSRYGLDVDDAATSMAEHTWLLLLKSVYAYEGNESLHGKYVYCRRPTLRYNPVRWYDEKIVKKALAKLLTIANNERNNLFERDLVDLTRQWLQIQAETIYLKIVGSFKKKNLPQFRVASKLFLDLLHDLDELLATNEDFLLGRFLEAAKALANVTAKNDDEHKRMLLQYEFNARNQITLWGPTGQIVDYATKQWNGIVIDYYLPRWSLFLQQLRVSLEEKVPYNQSKFQQDVFSQVELPFNQDTKEYPTVATGNAVHKASELFVKWKNISFN